MLKCTINGKEVEVKPGTTIIEAMSSEGQKIAHYCWHPGLSVAGVCRLCMVEIEGNPRLQIACNTVVTEGMKINNTSEKVKEAAKWGLDFHLINHPLDCPVCDQAGECGLQDQYMEFGKYTPEMAEPKQKKNKVVDLGPEVVLDSERCILCSRCVRFTDEVSKTHELGIFNRGDRSEIGTHEGKILDNKYSLNTVDICPVGALTSKDFRFRQRVWYLKNQNTICNGCSTGCNVNVYFNKEGFFRVKPTYNPQVNSYWMCDEGREIYKFANTEYRWDKGFIKQKETVTYDEPGMVALKAHKEILSKAKKVAFILTGQYTLEEYQSSLQVFKTVTGSSFIYHWNSHPETGSDFDGLLIRGDKNPNTRGLLQVLSENNIQTNWKDLENLIQSKEIDCVVVAGPENYKHYADFEKVLSLVTQVPSVIWMQSTRHSLLEKVHHGNFYLVPMKSFTEKSGTFVNHNGLAQKFKAVTTLLHQTFTLDQGVSLVFSGAQGLVPQTTSEVFVETARPKDRVMLETRKKNEFTFNRGRL